MKTRQLKRPPTMIMVDVPDKDWQKMLDEAHRTRRLERDWRSFLRECGQQTRLRRAHQ